MGHDARPSGGLRRRSLFRRAPLEAAGGHNESLIAGEEPELCFRLRRAGGSIERLDAQMTVHDADLQRIGQWWKRSARSGHAAAEAWALHGSDGLTGMGALARSALFYSIFAPIAGLFGGALLSVLGLGPWAWLGLFAIFALWGSLVTRVRAGRLERGDSPENAALYARYTFLGRFAETVGILKLALGRMRGRRATLIEYK